MLEWENMSIRMKRGGQMVFLQGRGGKRRRSWNTEKGRREGEYWLGRKPRRQRHPSHKRGRKGLREEWGGKVLPMQRRRRERQGDKDAADPDPEYQKETKHFRHAFLHKVRIQKKGTRHKNTQHYLVLCYSICCRVLTRAKGLFANRSDAGFSFLQLTAGF